MDECPAILVITTHGGWECDISGAIKKSGNQQPTVKFKTFNNPLNNVTILRATEGDIPNYLDQKIANYMEQAISKIKDCNSNEIVNNIRRELISLDKTNALSTLQSGESIRDTPMAQYSAEVDVQERDELRKRKRMDVEEEDGDQEESGRHGEMYLKQKNPYSIVKKNLDEKLGDKFFVTYAHERPLNCFQINDNRMQLYIPNEEKYPKKAIDIIPTWSPPAEQAAQGAASIILRRRDEYETNLSDILEGIKRRGIENLIIIDLTCNVIMYEGAGDDYLNAADQKRIERAAVRELRNKIVGVMGGGRKKNRKNIYSMRRKTRKNSPTKGWSKEGPKGKQRTRMYKRCGKKCFLGTKTPRNKQHPNFPICTKGTCSINNKGLYSAYVRARQWGNPRKTYKGRSQPRMKRAYYTRVANKAKKLLPQIYKILDKSAKTNVIKKNTASRKKSRITKAISQK